MAVLENTEYIRILFDKCYVDNFVHVCFVRYKSKKDREIEKETEEKFSIFKQKAYDVLSKLEENEFSNQLYDDLDKIEQIRRQYHFDYVEELVISDESLAYFEDLGFKKEWCDVPILVYPECTVSCGTYKSEEINQTYYYECLKRVMNNEIIYDI